MNSIKNLGIDHVIKRGTGEVIEQDKDAIFVRDSVSGAYMLACDDTDTGVSILDRYTGSGIALLVVTNVELGRIAFEKFGFPEKLECFRHFFCIRAVKGKRRSGSGF